MEKKFIQKVHQEKLIKKHHHKNVHQKKFITKKVRQNKVH